MTDAPHQCDLPDPAGIPTDTLHACACGKRWELVAIEAGPIPRGGAAWIPAEGCDCEFDPYDPPDPDDPHEESWHYQRTCEHCGEIWYGLHCPHDGYQRRCPGCGVRPTVIATEETP